MKDLTTHFSAQAKREADIVRLTEELKEINKALMEFNYAARADLIAAFDAGETTGDPLQDELIRCFGLNRRAIEKAVKLNRRITEAAGKEMHIKISYQIDGGIRSSFEREEPVMRTGHIFGTLSGAPLALQARRLSLVIPFERYVVEGFRTGEGIFEGPLAVSGSGEQPSALTLIEAITGIDEFTPEDLALPLVVDHRHSLAMILVNDEVEEDRSEPFGFIPDIVRLRKRLHEPDKALELIEADNPS